MKYNFSFLQVSNWLLVCKRNTDQILEHYRLKNYNKAKAIEKLEAEKKKILILKDIINKQAKLAGIEPEFIKNLPQIKKEYGVED